MCTLIGSVGWCCQSAVSTDRLEEAKAELKKTMTVKMQKKKEAATLRLQHKAQRETSSLVQKHSEEMLLLLQSKQEELAKELEDEIVSIRPLIIFTGDIERHRSPSRVYDVEWAYTKIGYTKYFKRTLANQSLIFYAL